VSAPRSPRALVAVCAALGLAALALWGASALTWARVAPAGRAPVELPGALLVPALTGLALLALAGVAGAVATAGVPRRLLGLLLVAAAVAVVAVVVPAVLDPVGAAGGTTLPTGAPASSLAGQPVSTTPAWALAVAGALVLAAAGAVLALREPRLARFGARYAAAGRSRAAQDPDRRAWEDLDEGRDPTAEAGPPTGSGRADDA
jgi:uncharacterized membrane protein (TIGR02234 family)